MYSIWEKQSLLTADIIIIGAGITGLSAAATLKEQDPNLKVTVLERGILPSGASTKNAGFACFGSVSELVNDVKLLGEDGMLALVEKRWDGLQKTCQRLGRSVIDIQDKSGYELVFDNSANIIDQVSTINEILHPFFQSDVFKLSNEKIGQFGFGKTHALIENHLEAQLDSGKLISSLWHYCATLGVQVHTGCHVLDIQEEENEVVIKTESVSFSGKRVGICTNAFANSILPNKEEIKPGRGLVLSIIPDAPLKFEGTFHYEEGYYYFRDYYGKLIFGGGRNLAYEQETTHEFGINPAIKEKLLQDVKNIILPKQSFQVELEWSGIMAFGQTKEPIVKKITDKVAMGVRLGGMGVAIGSLVGEEVAELLLSD